MWIAPLLGDSRKSCFLTTPGKWDLTSTQMSVVKIHQSSDQKVSPVYATCAGQSGLDDEAIIGTLFAKANNLKTGVETIFQVLPHHVPVLTSVIAEPSSEEDWELLEFNAAQVQEDILNRIRVVWVGAVLPIWLSEFVSLTIKIVEVEPKCAVGLLANDTEIHVSPPRMKGMKPSLADVTPKKNTTFSAVLSQLIDHYKPKTGKPPKVEQQFKFRVLPIEDPEKFLSLAAEINPGIVKQPYMAYISISHQQFFSNIQNCIGLIEHQKVKSYFNVNLIKSKDFSIFPDAIYLSDCLINQLKLQRKGRIQVVFQIDEKPAQCDNIFFYTFVQDYSIKELERDTKVWLKSLAKNDANLVLNHGQYVEVPCILEKKTNRLFTGLQTKDPLPLYCCIDEVLANRLVRSLKIIQIKPDTAPKFLLVPEDDAFSAEKREPCLLGGMDNLLQEAENTLLVGLGLTEDRISTVFSGCHFGNVLISGPRGSGRTSITQFLCNKLDSHPYFAHTRYIDCSALKGKKAETLQRDWQAIFKELKAKEPAILVLDDLDLLASYPQNELDDTLSGENWYYMRIADVLLELVKETSINNRVIIIATVVSGKALHPRLYNNDSSHFFTSELVIPPLTKEAKLDILQKSIRKQKLVFNESSDLSAIVTKMDGFVAADIVKLVEITSHLALADQSVSSENVLLTVAHFERALADFVPFGLHGLDLKPPSESRVAWNDVGGLANAKKTLIETLKWPTQYPEFFARCPIRLRSAALLYGAPGTGKTMLARAVATECNVNFISIKGPELLSKYIGASEESVRETFRRARSAKPCILFFDEFESLAPRRGHDSTGVTDRVVNQLLTELDGVEGQETGLWILAATSRPDLIDPALLRPGRFDVSVQCPLPDEADRLEILNALSSHLSLDDDVNFEEIARDSAHFSGADIQAVLYTAQLKAINQRLESVGHQEKAIRISHQLLAAALRETRPSVSASERQRYNQIYQNFNSGRGGTTTTTTDIGQARVTLA